MNDVRERRPFVAGAILITMGLLLFAAQYVNLEGAAVLGGIAAVFLALYAGTRAYGFLIPGMILAGLAVGTGLQDAGYDERGAAPVMGLGAAFLGIYVVNALVTHGPTRWWPLIPGGILTLIGTTLFVGGDEAVAAMWQFWPLVLVVAGHLVLIAPRTSREAPKITG